MHWPGIEPGSTAWKAAMLATIPPTLVVNAGLQELKRSLFGPNPKESMSRVRIPSRTR